MAQNKLFNLEQKVKESAQKYYTDGTSEMSDAEFDAAVEELRKMNPNSPVVNSVGWGYNINLDTNQSVPGLPLPDAHFLDDLNINMNTGVARNSNLDLNYPLIIVNNVGSNSIISEY